MSDRVNPQPGATVSNGRLGPTASDVRRRLLELVTSGARQPGERLGAERDLAGELGVSRATLRQALTALEDDGVILRLRGRGGGTFVAPRKVERDLSRIVGVPELLRSQGFTAGTRVVGAAVAAAGDLDAGDRTPGAGVASALRIAPDDLVVEILRLRLADGDPISLERARFPARRFPGLLELPLGGSLYELLAEHYGVRPREAVEQIEVVGAGEEEAAILRTNRRGSLLALTRTAFDDDGQPFEHSLDLFRADRTRLIVRSAAWPEGSARAEGRVAAATLVAP